MEASCATGTHAEAAFWGFWHREQSRLQQRFSGDHCKDWRTYTGWGCSPVRIYCMCLNITHMLSLCSQTLTDTNTNCCYSYWRHTETCHFFDRTGQPHFATDKCTISNQVYQVMPGGYKKLTANHNDDRQTSSGDRNIVLESKTMSLSAKVVCLTV